jgi:hypothetical protein
MSLARNGALVCTFSGDINFEPALSSFALELKDKFEISQTEFFQYEFQTNVSLSRNSHLDFSSVLTTSLPVHHWD